jgi:hypothetical protein
MEEAVRTAIVEAVRMAGQPPGLAKKLVAWCEAMNAGAEDRDATLTHLEIVYDAVVLDQEDVERMGDGSDSGEVAAVAAE